VEEGRRREEIERDKNVTGWVGEIRSIFHDLPHHKHSNPTCCNKHKEEQKKKEILHHTLPFSIFSNRNFPSPKEHTRCV
jgi:hypothetical protein